MVADILRNSVVDLRSAGSESVIQDIVAARLTRSLAIAKRRTIISRDGLPDIEVDILFDGFALEVKLATRFYQGIGQVLALRKLYDLDAGLLQIWRTVRREDVRAIEILSRELEFPSIVIDLKGEEVVLING